MGKEPVSDEHHKSNLYQVNGTLDPASDEHRKSNLYQVSGCYKVSRNNSSPPRVVIEHSCLVAPGNKWHIHVKCRTLSSQYERNTRKSNGWRNVIEVYPEAKVEEKHNDIEVTLPPLKEDIEIAAFGIPGTEDQKRMQMAIFGRKPTQGRDWKIWVYLIDDSRTAYKNVCDKEEKMGNNLLTALAGLFVSNSNEDIRIEINTLETGWQIKGNKVKTIKSNDAWHSPGNSTDFPRCHFEIKHVDKSKQAFFCGITASHETDQANTELVAYFERETSRELNQPSKALQTLNNTSFYLASEMHARLAVFFFISVLLNSGCKSTRLKGSAVHVSILHQGKQTEIWMHSI